MNLRVLLSDCRYPVHGPCLTSSDRIHPLVSVRRSHIVHRLGALVVRLSAGRPGGAQSSSQLDSNGNQIVKLRNIRQTLIVPINTKTKQELINTGIATLLYFIAFIVQLAAWSPINHSYRGSNIAAGVSFIAYLTYIYNNAINHYIALWYNFRSSDCLTF